MLNLISKAKRLVNVHNISFPKDSVIMKQRTHSSSSVELPQPMFTDSCGPFANYWSPQVSLRLHLNLVQHA